MIPPTIERPTFAELPPEWVATLRAAVLGAGFPCRVVGRRLEVFAPGRNAWMPKALPNGGTDLATEADAVKLWDAVKISGLSA